MLARVLRSESATASVRMNRPDVVISLHKMMELRLIPLNIYSFSILIKCFCDCHMLSFAWK
ncbi:predicted protein [Arabidopsis lyrata subsp. lyrata]|uniref:Predicted protein n=1 Tax=Arabidopsis lyrata subsp. lyrata TaxID=81972 RepID=D7KTF6_ARALL|nr:predicted protein [Arabidopsis lyrata subsp. lyrata]